MNVPAMFTLARELTHSSIEDYPDTRLLPFINVVKDDFWSYIITGMQSNYNWDRWTITKTVINQSEYVLPDAASDSEGNMKIDTVSVCYDWATYDDWKLKYVHATEADPQNLPRHWNWYVNNQPESNPIYYTADKSVFIAPSFKSEVTDWLEIEWIKSIEDYNTTTSENNVKIPSYLHIDLVFWIIYYIHKSEWLQDEASAAQAEYRAKRAEAASKIANRTTWPTYMEYPDEMSHNDNNCILNLY